MSNPSRGPGVITDIVDVKYSAESGSPVQTMVGTTFGIVPLSFLVGASDIEILQNNFMASQCVVQARSPHDVILVRGEPNGTAKLSRCLEQAEHDWVVCIQEDVWLPPSLDLQLTQQIRDAERRYGPVGVAGVCEVGDLTAASDDFTHPMSAEPIG